MANVQALSDAEFETAVLKSYEVVLVDFAAEWCSPCRAIARTVESLAQDFDGQLKVYAMDIDANQETPAKYSIRGLPTVLLFKNGVVVEQLIGVQPKENFVAAIRRHT